MRRRTIEAGVETSHHPEANAVAALLPGQGAPQRLLAWTGCEGLPGRLWQDAFAGAVPVGVALDMPQLSGRPLAGPASDLWTTHTRRVTTESAWLKWHGSSAV